MRPILIAAFIALSACNGPSTLHLALNSDDNAPTPQSSGPTLASAQHVNVTVDEVDVHVSQIDAQVARPDGGAEVDVDEVKGDAVEDNDSRWQVVSTTPTALDLMTVRADVTQALGNITIPAGKITQVRLKLHTDGDVGGGDDKIAGAVIDASGQTCDLIVPHSAKDPGVKIDGVFKAARVSGGDFKVIVNLRLADSSQLAEAATCTYRLNPHLEIKDVHHETEAEAADDERGSEHTDGGHESETDGGSHQ